MIDHFTSLLLDQEVEKEFDRIKNNEVLSSINIPYTILYIDKLIKRFERKDQFEKCHILLNYKNKKLDHGNLQSR